MPTDLYIAAGQDGLRLVSFDGRTWEYAHVGKEGETYRAAAVGNGVGVAVGSYGGGNIMAVTADGKAWKTQFKDAKYVRFVRGLAFGNGTFLALGGDPGAVGSSQPFVLFSKDGLAWDGPHDIAGKHILRRAAGGAGRFVAVGDRGRRAASRDGKAWDDAPAAKAIDTLVDVAFGNGVFVGVGLHGLRMATRDGLTWSARQTGEEGEHLNSVVWAKDRFVAVGAGATYTSADGEHWDRRSNVNAPQTVAYGAGRFVGAAWKGQLLASDDGVSWSLAYKADRHIEAVAFGPVE